MRYCEKIYYLCKNNSISFIFLATVYSKYYTNSDSALNVLRKPRSINDNGY